MKIELALTTVFKFLTFVLFTFMVLVYFGLLVLLPLDVLTQLIRVFSAVGFPTIVAGALSIGAVGYLGYTISRMPKLYHLVLDIGVELIAFGHTQLKRFDPLIEATRPAANDSPSTA